jgi:hypothetical protein
VPIPGFRASRHIVVAVFLETRDKINFCGCSLPEIARYL